MNKQENQNNQVELEEVHCSVCGRYLGFQYIIMGEAWWFCPRCKNFTVVAVKENDQGLDKE